jgi:hypothetical protein
MKIWISRGNFERLAAGLSPVEKAQLREQVNLYPDKIEPEWHIDQDRVAADLAELAAAGTRIPPYPPPVWRWWPGSRKMGLRTWTVTEDDEPPRTFELVDGEDTGVDLPDPWVKLGPGAWIAPADTPPPPLGVQEVLAEFEEWPDTGRYFLNGIVTTAEPNPEPPCLVSDVNNAMRYLVEHPPPPARRVEAGELALAAIAAMPSSAAGRGWPKDPTNLAAGLVHLIGLPIVCNDDLPANVWQVVDATTGEVLSETTISPTLEEYLRVARDAVDDLADKAGIPPFLLDPWRQPGDHLEQ